MSTILQTFQRSLWIQRLFALVLGGNVLLILWGIRVVPTLSAPTGLAIIPVLPAPTGLAIMAATTGMQVVIGFLAFFGPLSFQHVRPGLGIAVMCGMLFAIAYDGVLFLAYFPGLNVDVNIWLLFIGAASLAGFIAGYRTRRFSRGVIVAVWALVIGTALWSIGLQIMNYATWGTHQWYAFWLGDGAIDDFHRSGSTDLNVFLLQDMQGALFFHPLLSAFLGVICGVAASGLTQGMLVVRKLLSCRVAS